uniref:Tripartite motif containing 45 n=1 Tax=Tetraodon nigroviridis TaxID=99883 RepID=H3D9T9_TETNG
LNSCPVCCLNLYSREPKLLPCLHSFCKKCLPAPSRNLASAVPTNSRVDGLKPLNVIRCPVCRQECMEVDVMENVFVMDSVETPSSTVRRSAQICMTCSDNTEAVGFCVNCVEYLCGTCVVAHQRVKFTKDHTIANIEEVSKEIHGWSTQKPMFCDIHKQEVLKLLCETCDLLTCRDCQLVRHKDHSYHFLEDAYKYHREHITSMTHQLQEKRKVIEEVSNTINNRLLQTQDNHSSVQAEIKNSICELVAEMNKKAHMLLHQLENATRDRKSVLLKQKEDIGYLSRQWGHTVLMHRCLSLKKIVFQMGSLLQTKCNTSFVPQSVIRFQGRTSCWASSINLGSLLVESPQGNQLPGSQDPRQAPSGLPLSVATGGPQNTLAQLQMQVEKLNPPAHWQTQPPWTLCQTFRLSRSGPETLHGPAPSLNMATQLGCRFMVPPPSPTSLPRGLPNSGFMPQVGVQFFLKDSFPVVEFWVCVGFAVSQGNFIRQQILFYALFLCSCDCTALLGSNKHRNSHIKSKEKSQGRLFKRILKTPNTQGRAFWKSAETHQTSRDDGPSVTKRLKPSPGPFIIIKDEPENDLIIPFVNVNKRTSLPDSTGDLPGLLTPVTSQDQEDVSSRQRDHSDGGLCAVCRTGGQLLSCHKCSKQFHLPCHIPALHNFPQVSFVRCKICNRLNGIKVSCWHEYTFFYLLQKCERLLLHLFCSSLSPDFRESPMACSNYRKNKNGPTKLHSVRKRLEASQSLCYRNLAEFVSDVRQACRNTFLKPELGATVACFELNEQFEEHLRNYFPGQTFP